MGMKCHSLTISDYPFTILSLSLSLSLSMFALLCVRLVVFFSEQLGARVGQFGIFHSVNFAVWFLSHHNNDFLV